MKKNNDLHKNRKEVDGVKQPPTINPNLKKRVSKKKNVNIDSLVKGILKGNITQLSKAITYIESQQEKHQKIAKEIIEQCLPHSNNSIRIGITGVPGVGKSTFIESFGKTLHQKGKKIAILAVDPSSSVHHGSILGDKTRMQDLVKLEHVFIRPSPSGDSLGGVAKKTKETIILCEAAGFDTILIETVGVGQSETAVHRMVDFFLLLKLAGAGDELQGIKRGIIELADVIVINKADKENINAAKLAKREFKNALHLFPANKNNWIPKVTTCSALENSGIENVWQIIDEFIQLTKQNNHFQLNRNEQNKYWLTDYINQSLQRSFNQDKAVKKMLKKEQEKMLLHVSNPFTIAEELLHIYFNHIKKPE